MTTPSSSLRCALLFLANKGDVHSHMLWRVIMLTNGAADAPDLSSQDPSLGNILKCCFAPLSYMHHMCVWMLAIAESQCDGAVRCCSFNVGANVDLEVGVPSVGDVP
jgi:hypothetical protein